MPKADRVFLEGADCTGKTTLARLLVDGYGFHYRHEGPPATNEDLFDYYVAAAMEAPTPVVFDRFILGELVYGPILRGASRLGRVDYSLFRRAVPGVHVLMAPRFDLVAAAWSRRRGDEMLVTVDALRAVYDAYFDLDLDYDVVVRSWNEIPDLVEELTR